jgi:hypothetical protein
MTSTALREVEDLQLERALDPNLTLEEALAICEAAHTLAPESLEPFLTGIHVYENKQRTDLAGAWLDRGLRIFPINVTLMRARALVYEFEGSPDLALALWVRLAEIDPNADPVGAEAARCYMAMARLDQAIPRYAYAISHMMTDPSANASRTIRLYGEALLKAGDASGFIHYLKRLESDCGYYQIDGLNWWSGENLRGKRLFLTHQLGFGDQFLLAAIIPRLREQGCEVFMTVDDLVYELVATSLGPYYVRPCMRACVEGLTPTPELQAWIDEVKPDLQATLLHVPVIAQSLGIDPTTFFKPYMIVPDNVRGGMSGHIESARKTAAGRTLVGIAWDCVQRNQYHIHGTYAACFADRRSIPTKLIAALSDDPKISERYHFVSLVHGTHYSNFTDPLPQNMTHFRDTLSSFAATAAVIEACDFVASIDMSVSNLSTAMGKESWIMLQHEGEWRFGVTGERSPWLECARPFRQRIPFDWEGVLSSVRTALLERPVSHA